MVGVIKYELKLEDLQDYFSSLSKDQLVRYNVHCHVGGIERLVYKYLNHLLEIVEKGRYPIVGDDVQHVHSTQEGDYVIYYDENDEEVKLAYKQAPPEVRKDIVTEVGLVLAVLDSFKKINWKLQEKLGSMSYEKAPSLKKKLGHYVRELHECMVSISEFHHSERNRAFIANCPEGLDLDKSNEIRNGLYQFMDRVLEKEKDPHIDKFLDGLRDISKT